ncbi:hypothetical protein [Blastococcus sp. SYSU DS0541]
MSSVMENRAAVFTRHPQAVEVLHAGAWRAGELLGWRHDDSGACQMRVRTVVDGVEQAMWTALDTVRLPEPASARPGTQLMAAQPALRSGGGRSTDPEATASLPRVRDSRPERSAPARTGGRRRAPEGDEIRAATASSVPVHPSGRHRAPAIAPGPVVGRHRAADAELAPLVAGGTPAASAAPVRDGGVPAWVIPAARSAPPVELRPLGRDWTPPAGLEPELLTRPMRLSDQIPHSRRRRVDGSLSA